ncbi:MAG: DMT family transporter [Chloroflexota bacterium]
MARSIDWTVWGLLLLAASLELVGDLAFKWWAETDRWQGLGLGLIVYGVALLLFAVLLKRAELTVIFALWVGIATVLLALAGWWLFGETLSLRHLAGLTLVIGGIILLGK